MKINLRHFRLALALIVLVLSLPLLVWGFWPPHRGTRVLPLPVPQGNLVLPESRSLRLEYDTFVRAGDSGAAKLSLPVIQPASETSFYEKYTVIAEARLELPFANVSPADVVSNTLAPGGTATFTWQIRPLEQGTLRGEIWIYLRFLPRDGGPETRQPVSVQPVEIRSGSLLKRTGAEARAAGLVGLGVTLILGLPFIVGLARRKRREVGSTV